jgi:hypothetical protein
LNAADAAADHHHVADIIIWDSIWIFCHFRSPLFFDSML